MVIFQKPKSISLITDVLIVAGDFLAGNYLAAKLAPLLDNSDVVAHNVTQGLTLLFLMLPLLYLSALYLYGKLKSNTDALHFSFGDYAALALNVFAIGAIYTGLLKPAFPLLFSSPVFILPVSFGFMILWGWLHMRLMKGKAFSASIESTTSKKLLVFLLMFPFIIALTSMSGWLMISIKANELNHDLLQTFWFPALIAILLAITTWILCYLPRKILKSVSGANLKSGVFFWMLLADYFLRMYNIGPAF